MTYALGVDIGGTKIATVIINREYEILYREELKSMTDDKETMFQQVVKSIDLILEQSKIPLKNIHGIGVGVPGKINQQEGIAVFQNNLPWRNFPVVKRLQEYYDFKNVQIDNDVYLATFAEWQVSQTKEEDTFVYITVSTGVSCAIIHEGQFIRGVGFAGEVGLYPVIAKSSDTGIERLEQAASGPAIEKEARKQFNQPEITTKEVFEKYKAGCEISTTIINNAAESLAHGIYSMICLIDPHKIVFGGGVSNNNPFLIDTINSYLENHVIPEQQETPHRIQVSHFKENAGIIGAGLLGFKKSR